MFVFIHPYQKEFTYPFSLDFRQSMDQPPGADERITVPKSDWVEEILPVLNYKNGLLFLFPLAAL
jgi:hypothetical protein